MLHKQLIIIAALLLGSLAAMADDGGLVWLQTEHDFGAFSEDLGKVHCTFEAVNTSDKPIAVISARANCGCTVPKYSRPPVAPGDTIKIEVEYNAVGRPGRFNKTVYVNTTNDRKYTFEVKGTVVASQNTLSKQYPVHVGDLNMRQQTIMLGDVKKGRPAYGGLNLYNSSQHPIKPHVKSLPKGFSTRLNRTEIPSGEMGFLSLIFSSSEVDHWGPMNDHFYIYPDSLATDSLRIDITAIINEDFSELTPQQLAEAPSARISTESVDFDRIAGDKPLRRTFTISNLGKSPLIIRSASTINKALKLILPSNKIGPGKEMTAIVEIDPRKLPAATPLNARINLIFNDPANPTVSIRVVGTN